MMPTKELTNELLKSKMVDAMVQRRTLKASDDLNDIKQPGIYVVDAAYPSNTPSGTDRYIMTVTGYIDPVYGDMYVKQDILTNQGRWLQRIFWWGTWTVWKQVQFLT